MINIDNSLAQQNITIPNLNNIINSQNFIKSNLELNFSNYIIDIQTIKNNNQIKIHIVTSRFKYLKSKLNLSAADLIAEISNT